MKHRIIVLPEELEEIQSKLQEIVTLVKSDQKAPADPIFNSAEVLQLLKVSNRVLQRWRDTGIIEFSAINGKFYYRLSAIYKMLNYHLKTKEVA